MIEVMLGSETDDNLFRKLETEVAALGGKILEKNWGAGGSQEIITYSISLPEGEIEAVSETYIGLSLRGDENVIVSLAQRVLPNQAFNPDALTRAG